MLHKSSMRSTNGFLFAAFLIAASPTVSSGQQASQKSIRLTADGWIPAVAQVLDERDLFGYEIQEIDGGLKFSMTGEPGSSRSVKWTKEIEGLNLNDYSYIRMEYQVKWLNAGIRVALSDAAGKDASLIRSSDLLDDGLPHTLLIKNSLGGLCDRMTVNLSSSNSRATFLIKTLQFLTSEDAFSDCISYATPTGDANPSVHCLDITHRYNAAFGDVQRGLFEAYPVINDGGKYFSGNQVEVFGIPFQVTAQGKNLLRFAPPAKANEEIITHYGSKVRRGSVSPLSRDDTIELDVKSPATEVYFLLVAEHPHSCPREPKDMSFRIEDIESFAVELVYSDGTTDYAFPYSIKDRRHIIQGTIGAYVVPANGRLLDKVVFHNRTLYKEYYLAAVTVNGGSERMFPQLIAAPGPKPIQKPAVPDPVTTDPYLIYTRGILKAGNTHIAMTVDAKNCFTIERLDNRWLGEDAITLTPSAGFEVTIGEQKVEAKDISLLNVSDVTEGIGKHVTLTYGSQGNACPLEITIRVSVTADPEIGMQMTVLNRSDQVQNAKVLFPIFRGVQMGKGEDVWYYYPSYLNFFSNQSGSFDHLYSLSFPLQFYDVYNPVLGGGFYLATRETDVVELRRYGLRKNESGMTCYIEYPNLHTILKPGVAHALCNTVMGVHTGDWHSALNVYKKWLQTWYQPVKAQDKQWYRECFWLLCDLPDNIPDDARHLRDNFTWYDTRTEQYRMRDILAEHKRTVGADPDILHFWNWTYNMPGPYTRWGAYGLNGEYEKMGGIEKFNRAIRDIEDNLGIRVSIYIDASLCNPDLPIAKELGSRGYMKTAKGEPLVDYGRAYRMCPGSKGWREYMQGVYRRVNRDLGVHILYVDEWAPPFYIGHQPISVFNCYSGEHEHDVPANMNLEVHKYMSELRRAVPQGAALYGEYPDVDVNTQYYDSNISYYLSPMVDPKWGRDNVAYDLPENENEGLSFAYLNLYRFVFPGLVQLVLPNTVRILSWNRLKFTFLNGNAVYDWFWIRDESKAEAFMVKSHGIKKRYAECFASNETEAMVPTEQSGILANKYVGKGRSIWTIYNQRFTTVRGEILRVKHADGTTYYDVWNDRPLEARISADYAYISLEMHPQAIGCIVQSVKQ